ncbi:putative leucine-rich repeat-containing, plant-type, leucine-rich repeat domain superfamily [Helianthus annuus]|nr:putative leucine-rich repeat-containing, plant-type, leucine-rich repeat domain superfamily [Helianthus annuus]
MMFVFVLLLLCMGSFINGGLTSGLKEDANTTITRSCNDKERQALLGFKANLVDNNNNLRSWGDKNMLDCCYWVGVSCDNDTGHVTGLDLFSDTDGFSGNIISLLPLLLLLPRLQYLDLSGIDFQFNHIPNSLGSLSNLQHLKISAANLSGTIPFQLANLSNLVHLDLSNNSLSGPIPHQLANLSNLDELDLSSNILSGEIPVSFGDLTSLDHLDLSGNRLEGVIPKSFGNFSSLVGLDLSRNLLNGSVPNFVGCSSLAGSILNKTSVYVYSKGYSPRVTNSHGCPSLKKLDLSSNGLTGNLPDSVGKLLNLEYLDVSSNSLEGLISDVHFLNLTKLAYLDLSFNSFTLNLTSHALIQIQLKYIKMQSCKLGPSFPMWIQTQSDFAYLDISNAGISDHAPGWFWNLPRGLRFLNISSNEIKGMLPNVASEFERYPGMDLSYNQLEGTIPLLPSKLAALNLSGNRFSGTLSFLCQIDTALTFLDLSNNLLSGSLPECLQKFHEKLVVLNLSNNSLSGEIPSFLGALSKLQALYLRRNDFVGEIPESLSNCTKLRFVDLGENKLSGNIPSWIGETLSKLYVLVLRSNRFSGSLPSQICYLNNLQYLDLSNNALLGNIPRCFGNFTAMATRVFQAISHSYTSYVEDNTGITRPIIYYINNGVSSRRHVEICAEQSNPYFYDCVPNEEALFIDNALVTWKGTQREFGRGLYLLKSIDISSNKLYGKLPYEITNLRELVSLNFSDNKLHGEIPKHMGRLRSLESLDLSRNKFSGNIPLSLAQLTPLSYLDLSYNNLSGRIPLGPQLQLFNSSSYTGNPQLCGPPLTQRCGPPPPPPPPPATVVGKEDVEEDGNEFWISYYTGMGAGFAVGFSGICGALFLNRVCRYFFFASLNSVNDWIYVTVAVHFRSLHRKFRRV